MSKPKVLVSDKLAGEGVEILKTGADVDVNTNLTPEELIEKIGEYDALVVRSQTKVTKDVLDAGKNLKIVGRAGVGVDNIDVEHATTKKILVINAPAGNTQSAAEHTIAMMMCISRNLSQASASLRAGEWSRSKFKGVEVNGKTIGIIGLGRIGASVAKMAQGLGMKTIGFDPMAPPEKVKALGVESVTLDEIFKSSDYITVHTPKNKETYHMIGEEQFEKMKKGVRIVNCARGGIIDEDALAKAIEDGTVAGAALDVFEKEPPTDSPLLKMSNVLAVPHLGASTSEAQVRVAVTVAEEMLKFFRGEPVSIPVNKI